MISRSESGYPVPRYREASAAAVRALAQFARETGPVRIPVPVERIAGMLGYRVFLLTTVPDEVSGVLCLRRRLIGVNGRHHRHRRRFTVGHELGHILLAHPPEARCGTEVIRVCNMEADRCASGILLPPGALDAALQRGVPRNALALLFDVSREAMALALDLPVEERAMEQPLRQPDTGEGWEWSCVRGGVLV